MSSHRPRQVTSSDQQAVCELTTTTSRRDDGPAAASTRDEVDEAADSQSTIAPDAGPKSSPDRKPTEPEIESSPTSLLDTPSRRKNKRKMTSPRRRPHTDFSIRSLCSSSNSDDDDEAAADELRSQSAGSDAKIFKTEKSEELPAAGSDVMTALNEELFARVRSDMAAAAAASARSSTPAVSSRPPDFSFYPLNIPTVFRSIPFFVTGVLPQPPPVASHLIRPPSVDSLNSSGGDQDRGPPADVGETASVVGGLVAGNSSLSYEAFDRSSSDDSPSNVLASTTSGRAPAASTRRGLSAAAAAAAANSGRAGSPRKNYKNMTKQRRIEANARERSRVHLISAAFESLRRAVPSYSYNQRLSKLAILRIACSYILALARLADLDYSGSGAAGGAPDAEDSAAADGQQLSFAECVDLCTQTIQAEGKAKRRH